VVSAAAGAFSLGWKLPQAAAQSKAMPTEVGIWAVVHPDDTIVVRIARSEMGQGTMTGLAQLVADDELQLRGRAGVEVQQPRGDDQVVPPGGANDVGVREG